MNNPLPGKHLLKTNFRYDINALRAIAILGVLFFHYKVPFLMGGFSGVDIFFVISGYLMTKIIVKSNAKNEFSFIIFYGNRLKRIVPALLFLVLILTGITFFLYLPFDYMTNQKNAASSILFFSNILYWKNSSYFDPSSDANIFLHTWSLSVEWQFYLLYPLILSILTKVFKNRQTYIHFFIGITIFLIAISIVITSLQPTASFYLFPTRSWEMLVGGIAFFKEGFFANNKWRKQIAIFGYVVLLASMVFLNSSLMWPGLYTLVPVIATFLIIVADYNQVKFIQHDSLQFIGKISYSLYLWHWPIYVIARYFAITFNPEYIVLFTLLSVLLGYISYRYIESIKLNNSVLMLAMALLFTGSTLLSKNNFNEVVFKAKTLAIANYQTNHQKEIFNQFSTNQCFTLNGLKDFNKKQCLCLIQNNKNYLLIGDSHAAHLSESLRKHLAVNHINLLQAIASGGLPTVNFQETIGYFFKSKSRSMNREVMNYIYRDFIPKNAGKISGVIISAHWLQWNDIDRSEILKNIKETINYLNQYHIKTIIIGQSEVYDLPYATILAKDNEYNIHTSKKHLNEKAFQMNDFLQKNLISEYVNIINSDSIPPLSPNNVPYMFDENHYSQYGADIITTKIFANIIVKDFFK